MILSDRDILVALEDRLIFIDPWPDDALWTSTALDLTLDSVVLRWRESHEHRSPTGQELVVCPAQPGFNVQEMMQDEDYAIKESIEPHGYVLKPTKFILGYTREKIKLPHRSRIAGRLEGKSSLARIGVGVHVTAPTIHAGFGFKDDEVNHPGIPIQLEIFNLGPMPVKLEAGMPICQLILEEVRERPEKGYRGKFQAQQAFKAEL
jgi:dCTP deaminase